jgi:hypothetical protein
MSRTAAVVATVTMAMASLTGCGTSPYCQAVEDNKVALNSLGEQKTNAAYLQYAQAFRAVAKVAPTGIRKDWTKLADVTQGIVTAQRKAGINLEEMLDADKITKVSPGDLKRINDAYQAFNNTADERKAVVKNVKDECEIVLS